MDHQNRNLRRMMTTAILYQDCLCMRHFCKKSRKGAEKWKKILDLLEENPTMTQTMLMDILNLSRKQVQKAIKELQEQDMLEREGSNRSGRWIVKR